MKTLDELLEKIEMPKGETGEIIPVRELEAAQAVKEVLEPTIELTPARFQTNTKKGSAEAKETVRRVIEDFHNKLQIYDSLLEGLQ